MALSDMEKYAKCYSSHAAASPLTQRTSSSVMAHEFKLFTGLPALGAASEHAALTR